MIQYNNRFYSFKLEEIEGFEEVAKLTKQLSVIPSDFSKELLYDAYGKEHILKTRESLDSPPDKQKELKQEAKMNLNKVLPRLNQNIEDKSHASNKTWSLRPGHIAFNPVFNRLNSLNQKLNEIFNFNCVPSGDFLYPPNGYRSWHTNKYDLESWFVFFVDADKSKSSFFRFLDSETDELITHWDEPGTANVFYISTKNLFWHCIGTDDCNRWSQGFTLPENWKSKLKLLNANEKWD